MARRSTRRTVQVEILEKREVLSTPTADQQYTLWLLNFARQHPADAANLVTKNLDATTLDTINQYHQSAGTDTVDQAKAAVSAATPTQPLAWNETLAAAATFQSQDQINQGVETHNSTIGDLSSRLGPNHFNYANSVNLAEDAYAYADSPMNAMQAFLVDWGVQDRGHRRNILQPNTPANMQFSDVGVGVVSSNRNGMGPDVVTIDFGRQSNSQTQLVGVVFKDPANSGVFTEGSGLGGVTVNAKNVSTGQTLSTQTWDSGGYQMALSSGVYQVTAVQGNRVLGTQQVTITNQNVEADFSLSNTSAPVTPPTPVATPPTVSAPLLTPGATESITNVNNQNFAFNLQAVNAPNAPAVNINPTPNVVTINPLNPALPVTRSLAVAPPSTPIVTPPSSTPVTAQPTTTTTAPPLAVTAPATTSTSTPTTTSASTNSQAAVVANSPPTVSIPLAPPFDSPASSTPAIAGKSATPLFSTTWFASWRSWSVVKNN
jgi:uncharacterized protein YkwD